MCTYQRTLISEVLSWLGLYLFSSNENRRKAEQLGPPRIFTLCPQREWYTPLKQPSVASQKFRVSLLNLSIVFIRWCSNLNSYAFPQVQCQDNRTTEKSRADHYCRKGVVSLEHHSMCIHPFYSLQPCPASVQVCLHGLRKILWVVLVSKHRISEVSFHIVSWKN